MFEKVVLGFILAACVVWAAVHLYRSVRASGKSACNCADCPTANCGSRSETQDKEKPV